MKCLKKYQSVVATEIYPQLASDNKIYFVLTIQNVATLLRWYRRSGLIVSISFGLDYIDTSFPSFKIVVCIFISTFVELIGNQVFLYFVGKVHEMVDRQFPYLHYICCLWKYYYFYTLWGRNGPMNSVFTLELISMKLLHSWEFEETLKNDFFFNFMTLELFQNEISSLVKEL